MTNVLERRLRQQRARRLVRSWDYRQRRHARGAWLHLRRALTDAREAYAIPFEEARRLVAEGHEVALAGKAVEPPKLIVFAPAERVARIAGARPLAVRLSGELLAAECLALVPFETGGSPNGDGPLG